MELISEDSVLPPFHVGDHVVDGYPLLRRAGESADIQAPFELELDELVAELFGPAVAVDHRAVAVVPAEQVAEMPGRWQIDIGDIDRQRQFTCRRIAWPDGNRTGVCPGRQGLRYTHRDADRLRIAAVNVEREVFQQRVRPPAQVRRLVGKRRTRLVVDLHKPDRIDSHRTGRDRLVVAGQRAHRHLDIRQVTGVGEDDQLQRLLFATNSKQAPLPRHLDRERPVLEKDVLR